jgi:hypothetical protein
VTAGAQATGTAAAEAARDWQAVRAAGDIQYTPLPPIQPPKVPDWLAALGRFLERIFGPIGEWLGMGWPAFSKVLIGLAVLGVLVLLWVLLAPLLRKLSRAPAEPAPAWAPDRSEAEALLEDADRLAAEGRFDEATHLLLRRSVGQIARARPDWVRPASTARELGALAVLPAAARRAFAEIAARVERSRYALRPLGLDDWQAARRAYSDFALIEIAA